MACCLAACTLALLCCLSAFCFKDTNNMDIDFQHSFKMNQHFSQVQINIFSPSLDISSQNSPCQFPRVSSWLTFSLLSPHPPHCLKADLITIQHIHIKYIGMYTLAKDLWSKTLNNYIVIFHCNHLFLYLSLTKID